MARPPLFFANLIRLLTLVTAFLFLAPAHAQGRYVNLDGTPLEPAAKPQEAVKKVPPTDGRYVTGEEHVKTRAASDPVVINARLLLNEPKVIKSTNKADLEALQIFYEERSKPTWVTKSGLNEKGRAVIDELKNADDWGLKRSDFDLPDLTKRVGQGDTLADAEIKVSRAILRYVRYARGGRIRPRRIIGRWDQDAPLKDPGKILSEIEAESDVANYLRAQHPQHPQFKKLRKILIGKKKVEKKPAPPPQDEVLTIPDGPLLKLNTKHGHVALLRQRLKIPTRPDSDKNVFDKQVLDAVKAFQRDKNLTPDGVVGSGTRAVLNGKPRKRAHAPGRSRNLVILNMERWRWMPRNLGPHHIINNIPEYRTRMFSDGRKVFAERIIIGKPKTSTAIFSADMKYVIFRPSWGVPNGIKRTEILPFLKRKTGFFGMGGYDTRILKAHNLTVTKNGRPVDASKVNWEEVDITRYHFSQPPGPKNVLGRVKFRFPNRHDIYMHDTPERHLFAQSRRAESHGCIRVRNPKRLAEVILAEDKGYSADRVGRIWAGREKGHIELTTALPVHTGYFTAWVGDDGKLKTFADLYGYDRRTLSALKMSPSSSIADTGGPSKRVVRKKKKKKKKQDETVADIFASILNN